MLPRLLLTPGEPAGIGPDITVMLAQQPLPATLVAVADPRLLKERAQRLGLPLEIRPWQGEYRAHIPQTLNVMPVDLATHTMPGKLDVQNAFYVLKTLQLATDACLDNRFDALVTGPVQKSIINDAGIPFTGHTEFLQERCGVNRVVMMLTGAGLRVALATTHLPLRSVPDIISMPLLVEILEILHQDLVYKFGIAAPRILVCGLNPHAGEQGHLGTEEQRIISPTLEMLRNEKGYDLIGPLPADTLFTPRHLSKADAVLAMYHDQGLPVLKNAAFGKSVNITLGLPIIRTSVDHGTALDWAGTSHAEPDSLKAAIMTAIEMIKSRGERR